MSDKITDAEIVADLDQAIARMENSDSSWACVDSMKAARARLAAAPDMLAALTLAREYIVGQLTVDGIECGEVRADLDTIDAAIAKATGA